MRIKPSKGAAKNNTELPLAEFILQELTADISQTLQEQEKADLRDYVKYRTRPALFVKEVLKEPFITPDQEKVLESVVNNPITVLESANGTGKSYIMPRIGVWAYKVFPGAQVYMAAAPPEDNLKRIMGGELGGIIDKNKGLFLEDKVSLSSMEVKRSSLEFISGVTIPQSGDEAAKKARFSGKHAPYLIFLIDEGDALPKCIYEAIESCMSGGFARLVISYNPRSKSNPVYQMARSGNANVIKLTAFNHPNVVSGKNLIPGAVDREVTCRRIAEWSRPLVDGENLDNTFEVPEFLVGYVPKKQDGITVLPPISSGKRKIIQPEFSYMVLGEATSMSDNQLIDRDWCMRAIQRYKLWVKIHGIVPPNAEPTLLGLDVSEFGNDFNVETLRNGGFVRPQVVWGGVDITATSRIVEGHALQHQVDDLFIDSNGLGAGVWSNLKERQLNAHRIMVQGATQDFATIDGEVLGQFDRIRDEMWWRMREWLRTDNTAMLPDGETEEQYGLIDQLCAATYQRVSRTNRIKICDNDVMKEKLNGKSPDHATSLALTFAPVPEEESSGELSTSNYMYD